MHAQHQKGIPPAIPKGPIDNHEIYTMRKREKIKKVFFFSLLFPSLPTATSKKLTPNFCHFRSPQFVFCHCEPTYYPQNFYLDTSKYRQI